MSLFERSYDYTKEHKELEFDKARGGVVCTHCSKLLEERESLPDYGMFMGVVWAKQNLPCEPYDSPTPQTLHQQGDNHEG